jgi:hypothetical protein
MDSLLFLVLPITAFAHNLNFGNYLKLQEALASDNFQSALKEHKNICDKELGHYTENYKDCKKSFKTIDELRESFKSLSTVYIQNADKKALTEVQVVECPMARAKWIQKKGEIRNPYYGKSMLECGQKI